MVFAESYYFKECQLSENAYGDYLIDFEKNEIKVNLKTTDGHVLLAPIETDNGYVLIYLYKYEKEYFSSPDNDWNRVYQYALMEKQNRLFVDYINMLKNNIYINIFYK